MFKNSNKNNKIAGMKFQTKKELVSNKANVKSWLSKIASDRVKAAQELKKEKQNIAMHKQQNREKQKQEKIKNKQKFIDQKILIYKEQAALKEEIKKNKALKRLEKTKHRKILFKLRREMQSNIHNIKSDLKKAQSEAKIKILYAKNNLQKNIKNKYEELKTLSKNIHQKEKDFIQWVQNKKEEILKYNNELLQSKETLKLQELRKNKLKQFSNRLFSWRLKTERKKYAKQKEEQNKLLKQEQKENNQVLKAENKTLETDLVIEKDNFKKELIKEQKKVKILKTEFKKSKSVFFGFFLKKQKEIPFKIVSLKLLNTSIHKKLNNKSLLNLNMQLTGVIKKDCQLFWDLRKKNSMIKIGNLVKYVSFLVDKKFDEQKLNLWILTILNYLNKNKVVQFQDWYFFKNRFKFFKILTCSPNKPRWMSKVVKLPDSDLLKYLYKFINQKLEDGSIIQISNSLALAKRNGEAYILNG